MVCFFQNMAPADQDSDQKPALDKDLASTLIQQQIDHAIDLLQYKFGWGEQAREFSSSVLPMMTRGCPAIPDFTESNIE